MAISLAQGKRVSLSKVDAFADGVAVKTVRIAASLLACNFAISACCATRLMACHFNAGGRGDVPAVPRTARRRAAGRQPRHFGRH